MGIYRRFGVSGCLAGHLTCLFFPPHFIFLVDARIEVECRPKPILGTFSSEDGNADDDGYEKILFWFALYFFPRVIRVLFVPL